LAHEGARRPTSLLSLPPTDRWGPLVGGVPYLPPAPFLLAAGHRRTPTPLPLPRASSTPHWPCVSAPHSLGRCPASSSPGNGRAPRPPPALMVAAGVPAAHHLCALPPAPPPCIKGGHHPLFLPHHFPLSPRLRARYPELHRSRSSADRPSPSISFSRASSSSLSSQVNSSCSPLHFGFYPILFRAWELCFAVAS
jgi:hypothetical protein